MTGSPAPLQRGRTAARYRAARPMAGRGFFVRFASSAPGAARLRFARPSLPACPLCRAPAASSRPDRADIPRQSTAFPGHLHPISTKFSTMPGGAAPAPAKKMLT